MRSQTLANIIEIFENAYTWIYISGSGVESSFCTPYACLVFQQRRIQNFFKHLRWSVFAYPVNNFQLLTVYAKTLPYRCLKVFSIGLCSDCAWSSQQTSDGIFRIPKWLEDNLPSFEFFRKNALRRCRRKARRSRDSSPSSLLIRYNTHAP